MYLHTLKLCIRCRFSIDPRHEFLRSIDAVISRRNLVEWHLERLVKADRINSAFNDRLHSYSDSNTSLYQCVTVHYGEALTDNRL